MRSKLKLELENIKRPTKYKLENFMWKLKITVKIKQKNLLKLREHCLMEVLISEAWVPMLRPIILWAYYYKLYRMIKNNTFIQLNIIH